MTLATLTISQLWGISFLALAGGILVAGIVIDIRIAASRRRRERQAAARSGEILTGKVGAE
jgi:hypothetical protein